jgi:hypothetical protein
MHFVRTDRAKMTLESANVECDLSRSLHRIDVEEDATL